jgi:acyl dehydratase
MTPADMDGLSFGPVTHRVDDERIAAFVEATGDTPDRWVGVAPPAYSAVLLFKVAGDFLWDPRIAEFTTTLIHVDQSFTYPSPIYGGDEVVITGIVERVRERSDSYFVTFVADASVGDRPVLESRSTFLMSEQAATDAGTDLGEPPAEQRAINEEPAKRSLPAAGEADVITRSASRADLVRYAAVSVDFNPLHWDHAAARAAGLDGVVVHGLLQNAWLTQHAAAFAPGEAPVASIRARFRSALRPAVPATSSAEVSSVSGDGVTLSLHLTAEDATIVTAEAAIRGVTP